MRRVLKINFSDSRVSILCDDGHQENFFLREDLDYALNLLNRINSIKTLDGVSIYDLKKIDQYSVWSFGQQSIFWNRLRFFAKLKPVLDFANFDPKEKVEITSDFKEYISILQSVGFIKKNNLNLKRVLISKLLKFGARVISELSFIKIRFLGIKLLIYTPDKYSRVADGDFRFQKIYEFVKKRKVPYCEVFHTNLGRELVANLLKRRRLSIYLESLVPSRVCGEGEIDEFDFKDFDEFEKDITQSIIEDFYKWSQLSIDLEKVLRKRFAKLSIEKLFSMDDTRYTNELLVSLKSIGVKTYGFQHGHFTKYLVGWINPSIPKELSVTFEKLFVWNDYWKKVLLEYSNQYNESNVFVGGPLREPANFSLPARQAVSSIAQLKILLPAEPWSPKKEVGAFIEDLQNRGVIFYQSVRQDTKEDLRFLYGVSRPLDIKLCTKIDPSLVQEIDAVAGTYSTFLNDMSYYGKPILIFETSFNHGHRLVEDGVALLVKRGDYENLVDRINSYESKKDFVWPKSKDLEETLNKLISS